MGPLHDIPLVHRPCLARNLSAAAHQHQGGDTADAEAGTQLLGLFGIDFDQSDCRFELDGRLLEGRGHHPAGSAPGRPEIDEQGNVVFLRVVLETPLIQCQGLAGKKGLMALATFGAVLQSLGRDPVDAVAMGTDDMQGFTHDTDSISLDYALNGA